MSANKKNWLFPLLALGEFMVIFVLVKTNCDDHDTNDKDPPSTKKEVCVLPKNTDVYQPECANDDDCPSDSRCLRGACVITGQMDNEDGGESEEEYEEEFDAGEDVRDTARSCARTLDCGCGYDCVNSQCRKAENTCCADADCKTGDFCAETHNGLTSGKCTPWQCDTDEQCDRCGTRCENHLCIQANCCVDADCRTKALCALFGNDDTEGFCIQPECLSDADCECGKICNTRQHLCTPYSQDRPIPCCDGEFFYKEAEQCYPRSYIENGNCLNNTHCPRGETCRHSSCLPATCASNADCGCEAVCRKGHCEQGCDDNSGCCDKNFPVCDRGECVDPDAPDEDEEY